MDIPKEVEYSEILSVWSVSCDSPFDLTIGCRDNISLAELPFSIDGRTVRISSSADGRILYISNKGLREVTDIVDIATFSLIDPSASYLATAVISIMEELGRNSVGVIDVKVISNVFDVWAYVLMLDSDGLSALEIGEKESD